ncbi:hypothetical protein FM120_07495 [Sphingobacterium faecium PCAi_F2.5]|nr:hypothetical protein FM120_07495 [Sphingobacterium faecium PCAi_F2.5]
MLVSFGNTNSFITVVDSFAHLSFISFLLLTEDSVLLINYF